MFRLLFISGIVDRITVGQLHVGTVLIFYGGIVIGLFLKVITNSFGGESEASVRDFRSGLSGLRQSFTVQPMTELTTMYF